MNLVIGTRANGRPLELPRKSAVTSTFVVYGGKGMGKTNALAVFAEEIEAAGQRFSVIDPVGVSWGLQHGAKRGTNGLTCIILGGQHGDIPITPQAGKIVADFVADESVNTVIDISRDAAGKMWSQGERIRFVADYCEQLYQRQGEKRIPLMQIIDEAGRFCPQVIPKGAIDIARCVGAIEQLVEWGRNVGVGVCLVTQRSARMNKSVSELADCMIAFRTVGPHSLEAIMDWLGEHIARDRHKEIAEQLRALPIGSALLVSPGWLQLEDIVRVRLRNTFDSSKTPEPGKKLVAPGKATKPDLAMYRVRMATTIEQAEAADPRKLKLKLDEKDKLIAKLQAELDAEDDAPEHPALTNQDKKLIEKALARAEALVEAVKGERKHQEAAFDRQEKITDNIHTALAPLVELLSKHVAPEAPKPAPRDTGTYVRSAVHKPQPKPAVAAPIAPPEGLSRYAMSLLEVAVQRHPRKVTPSQVSKYSGKSMRSSAFDPAIRELVKGGYLGRVNMELEATAAALALFPSKPKARSPEEIVADWMGKLNAYERALFAVLVQEPERRFNNEELGAAAGKSITSSAFRPACLELIKSGLATEDDRGIQIATDLFQ